MPLSSVLGAQSLVRPGVCTSSTRPASPFEGQVIYETDTDLVQVYNGSGWKALGRMVASTNGSVLQVVSTTKTDTFTTTDTSFTDLTGLSVSITPSSTSNKVFVSAIVNGMGQSGVCSVAGQLVRDSTAIAVGTTAGSRTSASFYLSDGSSTQTLESAYVEFLDSPATTSATTYKIQVKVTAAGTGHINRQESDTDTASRGRLVSTITAMEIAG